MSIDRPTLEEFVRHAERYGSERVYETAAEGHLEPDDLGLLSLALQRIDRRWRLTPGQKTRLALALCERGLPQQRICEMTQLHRATLYRLRQQPQQEGQDSGPAVDSAQPCGADVAATAAAASDTTEAVLQHGRR